MGLRDSSKVWWTLKILRSADLAGKERISSFFAHSSGLIVDAIATGSESIRGDPGCLLVSDIPKGSFCVTALVSVKENVEFAIVLVNGIGTFTENSAWNWYVNEI